jgi:Ni/Fe-hydrogenase subunit HybB-like protein
LAGRLFDSLTNAVAAPMAGIWGLNNPVGWGWAIVNFVFWVGIGHAGTLISAVLFLFRQKWRTAINRFAEAMTIFAVICALMFPGIHVGRIWAAYWMFPLPNQMGDVAQLPQPAAVGRVRGEHLLHGVAALLVRRPHPRPRHPARPRQGKLAATPTASSRSAGAAANRHWQNYERAYLILAGLATPLVLSVHTIVSFDFAVSVIPGWHTTIFPPYFVAGAIFSGFAMVLTLAGAIAQDLRPQDFITVGTSRT